MKSAPKLTDRSNKQLWNGTNSKGFIFGPVSIPGRGADIFKLCGAGRPLRRTFWRRLLSAIRPLSCRSFHMTPEKFVSILIWSFFLNLISTSKGWRMLQHSSQQRKNGEAKRVSMLLKFKFRFHPILLYFINYGFCFRLFWKSSTKFWSQLG